MLLLMSEALLQGEITPFLQYKRLVRRHSLGGGAYIAAGLASRSLSVPLPPSRALSHALSLSTRIASVYRGTSLIRKRIPLKPYRRPMPRVLWWFKGVGFF